jgi:signal transduction histidine kinase
MKLSKKKEKELMQVYEAYWAEYLNGNVDAMQALLDDSYTQIGSAESEVFSSKKEAVQFLVDTIDQVAGKLEMRNRSTKLEQQDHLILIHEVCDLYALADKKWIFYSKFRASTLLQEKKEGWKITHQHSSFPDTKTEAGQNVAIDKIAEENKELREAVKRRTVELEQKNRELQIEAALEKVRSQSLAMHTTGEMQLVANAVYKQLHELGLEMDAVGMSGVIAAKQDYDVWVGGAPFGKALRIPYNEVTKVQRDYNKMLEERPELFAKTYTGTVKEEYINHLLTHGDFPKAHKKKMETSEAFATSIALARKSGIQILRYTKQPYSGEDNEILKRFSKVFEQAYIRFMDLQKAEAQARESQIEMALERVRTASMTMQKGEELAHVISVVFTQLKMLGIDSEGCGLNLYDENDGMEIWMSGFGEDLHPKSFYISYFDHPYYQAQLEAWKEQQNYMVLAFEGKLKRSMDNQTFANKDFFDLPKDIKEAFLSKEKAISSSAFMKYGMLEMIGDEALSDDQATILCRFAKVFEQAYQRFLDIEKADAQAREAQIEGALERVRSKTMAMHNSEDLEDIVVSLFDEVMKLGLDKSLRCGIGILEDHEGMETRSVNFNSDGTVELRVGMLDMTIHPMLVGLKKAWKNGSKGYSYEYTGKDVRKYYEALNKEPEYPFNANLETLPEQEFHKSFIYSSGIIFAFSKNPISEESSKILARFAAVFGQTYRRFLDLQKAEAQAREAQIEAALERVRSRSMAMHESKEMLAVIEVVSEQLQQLNLNFDTVSFAKNNQEGDFTFWITSRGQPKPLLMEVPTFDSPVLKGIYKAQKKGFTFLADFFSAEVSREWHEHLIKYSDLKLFPEKIKDFILNAPGFARSSFLLKNIDLYVGNYRAIPFTDEENSIFKRFAHVFEQSYTRFLDLQKAEDQAREAQIEAALEKVRSRTMAMHNSEELAETALVLYEQFSVLGNIPDRMSIGIFKEETKEIELWPTDQSGSQLNQKFTGSFGKSANMTKMYEAWKADNDSFVVDLSGQKLKTWLKFIREELKLFVDDSHIKGRRVQQAAFFSHGMLLFTTNEPVEEEIMQLLIRFAGVFSQTYTRFLDLKKAEAQAREAVKQASLDRVRGQIASMRDTEDLQRITPLVFNELTTLGVPFFRCGVFIIHEKEKKLEVYLSAPDGHSLGVLHLPFNVNSLTQNSVENWKKNKVYHQHWNKEDFVEWTQSMLARGQIQDAATYQGAAAPPDSLDLHFIPFTQGMLYVGNTDQLQEDDIDLVRSLAEAFSIAYARYEDFTKLEKAKESVEATLTELKATQNQLVQSEKMASLGELTAGIAHEIQNPLNFVNNFSEVSKELLEEMMEEMQKGDVEEVKALAEDIIQNLEKINHHGKRADGIVKGMLQHSRTSSGEKEPTDINALADEYLRLAYHGLRAKDQSFNAIMKTDFGENIGDINIIPQDIGRVMLNLITNAFYVVDEKSSSANLSKEASAKLGASGDTKYEPTISISTKKEGDKVFVSVTDNGNGIPKKVLAKIFQPFFTTKPTGQGTGLGLSLSYDIIKSHGGEINVDTKQNEGTTFTITLPVNNHA